MTLLPIVERELRVAARRKVTWSGRLLAALSPLLVFAFLQIIASASGAGRSFGPIEFAVFKWAAFIFAWGAGILLASDSVSEEKREGTLGLLFLTDLRGYDVIFGKLVPQCLRAFYPLLAAFPIIALSLLAGGVTGREFALSLLVIVNTLFLSLGIGLLASTISREYVRAINIAGLLSLVLLFGTAADSILTAMGKAPTSSIFSLTDPAWLFTKTPAYESSSYWAGLAIQHGIAWGFLILASVLVPRVWQEKSTVTEQAGGSWLRRWRYGGPRFRADLRRRFMESRPAHWLMLRDRLMPRLLFVLGVLILTTGGWTLIEGFLEYNIAATGTAAPSIPRVAMNAFIQIFRLGLILWVAAKACHIFVESVRNGALELLLVTPVTAGGIIQAQWAALWRTFSWPVVCLLLLEGAGSVLGTLETSRLVAGAAAPTLSVTNSAGITTTNIHSSSTVIAVGANTFTVSSSGTTETPGLLAAQVIAALGAMLTLPAGLAAIAWFGMWMGISNQRISVAVLKTICFVYVLPAIALSIISGLALVLIFSFVSTGAPTGFASPYAGLVLSSLIGTVLNLTKDVWFITWSRRRLMERFQFKVAQAGPSLLSNRLTT